MTDPVYTHSITRVDSHQVGKISGFIYAVLGIIIGVFMILIGLGKDEERVFMIAGGVLAPLLYGVIGYLSGRLMAALFNWSAKKCGGISMTLVSQSTPINM